MSEEMHRASHLPNLEESHLSDAGPVADISHFVMPPQSHPLPEFVPLG